MKLLNTQIALIILLILSSCTKEGLWNQNTKVQKGRVIGTLVSSEDGSPLSGVKILFERQTQVNGSNSFVDTVGTDVEGKFTYDIPFPNKVRVVLRDTGRYVADTAFVEVSEGKDYNISLATSPRFGVSKIISKIEDEVGNALSGLKVALFLRESNLESYSPVDTIITDENGLASFTNIAFPVFYKVKLAEHAKAYEIDSLQGKLTTKDDLNLILKTRAKFGKGTIKITANNYFTLNASTNEKIKIQTKSVFEEEFSTPKEYQLDASGQISIPNFVYPSEIKISPAAGEHPFAEISFSAGETEIQNGVTVELRDLTPRYATPVYSNLVVSTLEISATLSNPTGITTDSKGNLYFSDGSGHKLYKVDRLGELTLLIGNGGSSQDGTLETAKINQIWGLLADKDDNLYFVDNSANGTSHKVRKITFDDSGNGIVSTIAGSGSSGGANAVGTAATFNRPSGLAIDNEAQILYVAEWGGHRVRKIELSTNTVTTLVGTGSGTNSEGFGANAAVFQPAIGIALSPDNKKLYIGCNASNSDGNSRIGVVDLSNGSYKFFVGNNGNYAAGAPRGMFITPNGDLIYSANAYRDIRKVSLDQPVGSAKFTKLAGSSSAGYLDGDALQAKFSGPLGVCYNPWNGNWYIADGDGSTKKIRVMRSKDID